MTEMESRRGEGGHGGTDDLLGGEVASEDIHPRRAVMRLWRQAKAASKLQSQARRARVLAHPDLASVSPSHR
jgi:hypothetical protein